MEILGARFANVVSFDFKSCIFHKSNMTKNLLEKSASQYAISFIERPKAFEDKSENRNFCQRFDLLRNRISQALPLQRNFCLAVVGRSIYRDNLRYVCMLCIISILSAIGYHQSVKIQQYLCVPSKFSTNCTTFIRSYKHA